MVFLLLVYIVISAIVRVAEQQIFCVMVDEKLAVHLIKLSAMVEPCSPFEVETKSERKKNIHYLLFTQN